MFTLSLLVLCFCLAVPRGVAATSLALYSDSSCTTVTNNLAALDGYPDGQCTGIADLSGGDTYNSLKFLTLDAGCAITLYGPDSDVCSGPTWAASLGKCYNTSWTYYSVDGCTVPSISVSADTASASATNTASSTATAAAATVTVSGSAAASPALSGGGLAGVIIVAIIAAAGVIAAGMFFLGRGRAKGGGFGFRSGGGAGEGAWQTALEKKPQAGAAEEGAGAGAGDGAGFPGAPPRQYGSLGVDALGQRAAGGPHPVYEANSQGPVVNEMPGHHVGELPERPY